MILFTPNRQIASKLRDTSNMCGPYRVDEGALPPKFIWDAAIADNASAWVMPRLIVDVQQEVVVGAVGCKAAPHDNAGEIGYNVAVAARGRGYASEGVRLFCQEVFSSGELSEIRAETLTSNIGSQRVLEHVGFTVCGARIDSEGQLKLWHLMNRPKQSRDPKPLARINSPFSIS